MFCEEMPSTDLQAEPEIDCSQQGERLFVSKRQSQYYREVLKTLSRNANKTDFLNKVPYSTMYSR